MKKRIDFEEILNILEKKLNSIMDGVNIPENHPINISVYLNIIPVPVNDPGNTFIITTKKQHVDILETDNNIHVVIGLSGIEPKDIMMICSGKNLEIRSNNPEISIHEFIELPAKVNKTGMKTLYDNGILEIIFNKTKQFRKSRNTQQSY